MQLNRANARQRYSKQVVELTEPESDGLTERIAKIERTMQKSQRETQRPQVQRQLQQHGKQVGSPKKNKKFGKQQICAAIETSLYRFGLGESTRIGSCTAGHHRSKE